MAKVSVVPSRPVERRGLSKKADYKFKADRRWGGGGLFYKDIALGSERCVNQLGPAHGSGAERMNNPVHHFETQFRTFFGLSTW